MTENGKIPWELTKFRAQFLSNTDSLNPGARIARVSFDLLEVAYRLGNGFSTFDAFSIDTTSDIVRPPEGSEPSHLLELPGIRADWRTDRVYVGPVLDKRSKYNTELLPGVHSVIVTHHNTEISRLGQPQVRLGDKAVISQLQDELSTRLVRARAYLTTI